MGSWQLGHSSLLRCVCSLDLELAKADSEARRGVRPRAHELRRTPLVSKPVDGSNICTLSAVSFEVCLMRRQEIRRVLRRGGALEIVDEGANIDTSYGLCLHPHSDIAFPTVTADSGSRSEPILLQHLFESHLLRRNVRCKVSGTYNLPQCAPSLTLPRDALYASESTVFKDNNWRTGHCARSSPATYALSYHHLGPVG